MHLTHRERKGSHARLPIDNPQPSPCTKLSIPRLQRVDKVYIHRLYLPLVGSS